MKLKHATMFALFAVGGLSNTLNGAGLAAEIRYAPATTRVAMPQPAPLPALLMEPASHVPLKPAFLVESGYTKRIDVDQPPPLPGLPPVEGTVSLRVLSVANPGIPDPPPPPVRHARIPTDAASLLAEASAAMPKPIVAFVSATVYDRSRTLLTVYPQGGRENAVSAWSNLDFNHFTGFTSFDASEPGTGPPRAYQLFMGVGNRNAAAIRRIAANTNLRPAEPEIPPLPDAPPAFILLTENPDPQALRLIEDLHALHRAEGHRMRAAAIARENAEEQRRAQFLANPPKPADVTIHFWKRNP